VGEMGGKGSQLGPFKIINLKGAGRMGGMKNKGRILKKHLIKPGYDESFSGEFRNTVGRVRTLGSGERIGDSSQALIAEKSNPPNYKTALLFPLARRRGKRKITQK